MSRRTGREAMTAIEYLDPPPGWFVLDVMRRESRKWDWSALMVDVDPDDLKNCACDFPALFYVHPKEYRPGDRAARQRWFNIPGKHRNKDAAWEALEDMMTTRH
jgi:hypothetical protein